MLNKLKMISPLIILNSVVFVSAGLTSSKVQYSLIDQCDVPCKIDSQKISRENLKKTLFIVFSNVKPSDLNWPLIKYLVKNGASYTRLGRYGRYPDSDNRAIPEYVRNLYELGLSLSFIENGDIRESFFDIKDFYNENRDVMFGWLLFYGLRHLSFSIIEPAIIGIFKLYKINSTSVDECIKELKDQYDGLYLDEFEMPDKVNFLREVVKKVIKKG